MMQGGIAINFAHSIGALAEHTAWFVSHCLREGITEAEATMEAQEAWFGTLLANLTSLASFYALCTPRYMNGEGSREASAAAMRAIPFFGGTNEYIGILLDWREASDLRGMAVKRAAIANT